MRFTSSSAIYGMSDCKIWRWRYFQAVTMWRYLVWRYWPWTLTLTF